MNKIKSIVLGIAAAIALGVSIWGAMWLTKHGSYALFYEDMVKETVRKMVKPECLKDT